MAVVRTMEIVKEALEHCIQCSQFDPLKRPLVQFALDKVNEYLRSRGA